LATFSPRTGQVQYWIIGTELLGMNSLTYRKSDGQLYALLTQWGPQPRPSYLLTRLHAVPLWIEYVCQIQPVQIDWQQQYGFNNDPPINLAFDPASDGCYYQSSLSGDGGVLFRLDVSSGQSTVEIGVWDATALAFEPMSNRLFGISPNQGPGGRLWEAGFKAQDMTGTGYLAINILGGIPTPLTLYTTLAFVPHVERD
jgi:hypothetical protein